MTQPEDILPDCYGKIEIVFPMGNDGLRHTPAPCLECAFKTECLRAGLQGKAGLKIHEEHLDRSYHSGTISFVERWSRKKTLERLKEKGTRTSRFKWRLLRLWKTKPSN
jgi:hypothetical protein